MAEGARARIDDFLSHKRLAVVGVSRRPTSFSRRLFHDLAERGYDVVPVNPELDEVEGRPCFARIQDIPVAVEGALLLTKPDVTTRVALDCVEAGVPRVWMHRGGGRGAASDEGIAVCREHGIELVTGHCPYMFLPKAGWVHAVHRFFKKMNHSYPQ